MKIDKNTREVSETCSRVTINDMETIWDVHVDNLGHSSWAEERGAKHSPLTIGDILVGIIRWSWLHVDVWRENVEITWFFIFHEICQEQPWDIRNMFWSHHKWYGDHLRCSHLISWQNSFFEPGMCPKSQFIQVFRSESSNGVVTIRKSIKKYSNAYSGLWIWWRFDVWNLWSKGSPAYILEDPLFGSLAPYEVPEESASHHLGHS